MSLINLAFCTKVNDLLSLCPGTVTSWVRTPRRNTIVGGAPNSWHLSGQAVDLIFDSVADLFKAAHKAVELGFGGVEVDLINNHLHLDARGKPWHVVCTTVEGKRVSFALSDYVATV